MAGYLVGTLGKRLYSHYSGLSRQTSLSLVDVYYGDGLKMTSHSVVTEWEMTLHSHLRSPGIGL